MLRVEYLYWLVGAFLIAAAIFNLRERRYITAGFWLVFSTPFLFGDAILSAISAGNALPAQAMGVGVIVLGLLAACSKLQVAKEAPQAEAQRQVSAQRIGNRLFLPALAIPVLTMLLFVAGPHLQWNGRLLLDGKALTVSALAVASLIALIAAVRVTRSRVIESIAHGRRVLDALSWAVMLPMVLATLGGVFTATGVGDTIAAITSALIPVDSRMACLLAFSFGMVIFTVVMGNAFAAFPVIMAGIGLPLLVLRHGADPAILGAIGMLTGYCGTLLTPMAANFNIVPAVLLELPSQYAVIRSQLPTAICLMIVNIALMAMLVFR